MADTHFGGWIGTVEYVSDPLGLNRVRVRIPAFHGIKSESGAPGSFVPTEALPWAQRIQDGEGRATPLRVNSQVMVIFLNGDPDLPYVLGVVPGAAMESVTYGPDKDAPGGSKSNSYESLPGPQIPREAQNKHGFDPTVHVVGSSPSGGTIYFDDTKGRERAAFLDRLGQGLILRGAAVEALARTGDFSQGTQVPKSKVQGQYSSVSLGDCTGQEITLSSASGVDAIDIVSKTRAGNRPSPSRVRLRLSHTETSFRVSIIRNNALVAEISMVEDQMSMSGGTILISPKENCIIDSDATIAGNLIVGDVISNGRKL